MQKGLILLLTLVITVGLFNCSVDPQEGGLSMNRAEAVSRDSGHLAIHPFVYRVEIDGTAYIYEKATRTWSKKITNVRAIEGGVKDIMGQRMYNSFYVDRNGQVFEETAENVWTPIPGIVDAIDISSNGGQTYAVSSDNYIYKYYRTADGSVAWFNWHAQIDGDSIEKVDVDDEGNPWVITGSSQIYKYADNSWQLVWDAPLADPIDIAVGSGEAYISAFFQGGIYPGLFKYDSATGEFVLQHKEAYSLDIDKSGVLWATFSSFMSGSLHYLEPGQEYYTRSRTAGYENAEL